MRTASGNRYGSTISGEAYPSLCVALRCFATETELEVTSSVTRVSTMKLRTTVSPSSLPRRALDGSTLGTVLTPRSLASTISAPTISPSWGHALPDRSHDRAGQIPEPIHSKERLCGSMTAIERWTLRTQPSPVPEDGATHTPPLHDRLRSPISESSETFVRKCRNCPFRANKLLRSFASV